MISFFFYVLEDQYVNEEGKPCHPKKEVGLSASGAPFWGRGLAKQLHDLTKSFHPEVVMQSSHTVFIGMLEFDKHLTLQTIYLAACFLGTSCMIDGVVHDDSVMGRFEATSNDILERILNMIITMEQVNVIIQLEHERNIILSVLWSDNR